MAATLRFEVTGQSNPLVKALEREHQRIIKDERLAQQTMDVQNDHIQSMKSDWIENLETANLRLKHKMNKEERNHELQEGGKALTMIRRSLLRDLLETEHLEQEHELNKQGKAFYVKRV